VDYRRLEAVTPADMPATIASADIVLDQFALGSYGVMAVQSMAAGRVVVGHVPPEVRARVGREVPIVEADPTTLAEVVRDLVTDRSNAREAAKAGPGFAEQVHGGARSARVLREALGLRGS
jgi:hypothetical protein